MQSTHVNPLLALLGFLALTTGSFAVQQSFPDFQNYQQPNPAPVLPGYFDSFAPPVDGSTPPSGVPEFSEFTRSASPDRTVIATMQNISDFLGLNAGQDSQFVVYGEDSSSGMLTEAAIQRLDVADGRAMFTLSPALPAWSTYFVWARNDTGFSYPIAINRTDAWWLGPNKATRGDEVSIYGRNLAHGDGTTDSWVFIKPIGSAGQWAAVTEVNPYKVSFTIPVGLSNGDYEVWIHNGHAQKYGWSGPLSVTVDDGIPDSGITIDATSNGVANLVGDGVSDNSAAWTSLVNAHKNSGNTINIPAGDYVFNTTIRIPDGVIINGAGKDQTYLLAGQAMARLVFGAIKNTEIKNLTISSNGYTINSQLMHIRSSDRASFISCRFDSGLGNVLDIHNSNRFSLLDCELIGGKGFVFLGGAKQLRIIGCDLYGRGDANTLLYTWGGSEIDISGCTAQDYDNSDPSTGSGWAQGRFVTGTPIWGTLEDIYVGDNATIDLTVRPGYWNQNTGEHVMWETAVAYFEGHPVSATATTVTFDGSNGAGAATQMLQVVAGRGEGQSRRISSYDSMTDTVTLDRAWDMIPDSTSTIIRVSGAQRIVTFRNEFDGKDRAFQSSSHIASSGFSSFAGGYDIICDGNLFTDLRYGYEIWSLEYQGASISQRSSTIFNIVQYNTIDDVWTGARNLGSKGGVYRDNDFSNIYERGWFLTGQGVGQPIKDDTKVFEFNSMVNINNEAVWRRGGNNGPDKNILFRNNSFDRGTGAYAGSIGFEFDDSMDPVLVGNFFSGFETLYAGTFFSPQYVLELPYRVTDMKVMSGSTGNADFEIVNAGIATMSWSATTDVAWLSLSSTSGSINEQAAAGIVLTTDARSLSPGSYTGHVTVSAGSLTKTATVYLTVEPVPLSLIGYWNMDDNNGDSLVDDSIGSNDGALIGGVAFSADSPSGLGYSIDFDGANDYVDMGNGINPISGDVTIGLYAKSDTSVWQGSGHFIGKTKSITLSPSNNQTKIKLSLWNASTNSWLNLFYDPGTIPGFSIADWHHYAVSYNGTTGVASIYVDGVLRASSTFGITFNNPAIKPLRIGTNSVVHFFTGKIDEVRVYDDLLDVFEIQSLL